MRFSAIALVLVVAGACGGGKGGSDPSSFKSVEVDPPTASVKITLGGMATQAYQVFGVNGSTKVDITDQCSLSVDPSFGAFNDTTVTVGARGGQAEIDALCGEVQATPGQLTINVTGSISDPSAPAGAGDMFGGATLGTDPTKTPVIEYPIDQAVSPRNIPSIEFQWQTMGNDLFHLTLTSTYGAFDIYTKNPQETLQATDWASVAGTVAGDSMKVTVEGLATAAPTTKYASTVTTITMSIDSLDQSAIYYWASSAGNIMNQTFGDPTAPTPVAGNCTACHAVSKTASRMGYSRCTTGTGGGCQYVGFLKYNSTTTKWDEVVNADAQAIPGSFNAFAPVGKPFTSDDKAVTIVSMNNGTFQMYDPDSGMTVPSNVAIAQGNPVRPVTMADWSSDGNNVVYASGDSLGNGIDITGGRIMKMSYDYVANTHVFGTPTQIVPNPITLQNGVYNNFFFPAFSTDTTLVVFDAARDHWRNTAAGMAASPGQRIMLSDAGGAWAQDLTNLNGGFVDLNTTWPHWAPAPSINYYWIVFSSERNYGHEVTQATSSMIMPPKPACVANGVKQCKQIWIAAIAKDKINQLMAGQAVDPSFPPMWLPGQDTTTDNISPFWAIPPGLE